MIDPKSLETLKPKNRVVPGISGSILPDQLTGNQKLTLSSMVYGFSFGDKVWGKCGHRKKWDKECVLIRLFRCFCDLAGWRCRLER